MEYSKKTQSIMSNRLFTTVPVPKFPRSVFSLSRPVLFTPRMHKEYPTEILEVIPGDGFKIHTEAYAKSQPMVAPTFAKMDVSQESFFVPCWQLSKRFDDFITGGERGTNTDKMPFLHLGEIYSCVVGFIYNAFGIDSTAADAAQHYNESITKFQDILEGFDIMRSVPFSVPSFMLMGDSWDAHVQNSNYDAFVAANSHLAGSILRVNLLPFAAVLKIWCEFYRDENLCDDLYEMYWLGGLTGLDFSDVTGDCDTPFDTVLQSLDSDGGLEFCHSLFGLRSRAWKKDYFTSALPFVQKGPEVQLPLGGTVPVHFDPSATIAGQADVQFENDANGGNLYNGAGNIKLNPFADLSNVTLGSSIQDLRTAFKLEEMYEADGRFGSRYPENTLGQFGVRTPDSRLPRCQFLGSSRQPVQIQQVVQNSSTDNVTPQGNLAGLSSSYGSSQLAKTYQSQHGFIVCLTCIRVHSLYQQGIHPMFSRYDRTEYAWPRFAHLGEQAIYTKQLFVDGNITEDDVFGYTPRYADYKSDTGSIHGRLKTNLNYWTMARRFANKPVLNEEFIYSRPRQDAFVVTNHLEPCFVMELDYHVRSNRLLPFYGQPHM